MSKELNLSYIVQDTIYILLGILFSAFAMKSFLVPNHFLDGGVTGISLLGHEVFHWNLGLLLILTNLPFIIMGAYQISKGFAIKTAIAVVGLAIALQYIEFPTVTSDNLLVSMFGGFFLGLGIGLAMRGGCAIDGLEVLALYTLQYTACSFLYGVGEYKRAGVYLVYYVFQLAYLQAGDNGEDYITFMTYLIAVFHEAAFTFVDSNAPAHPQHQCLFYLFALARYDGNARVGFHTLYYIVDSTHGYVVSKHCIKCCFQPEV